MNTAMDKLDKNKRYKLACGHNNIAVMNVWPFDTFVCLDCGFKTGSISEDLNVLMFQDYIKK